MCYLWILILLWAICRFSSSKNGKERHRSKTIKAYLIFICLFSNIFIYYVMVFMHWSLLADFAPFSSFRHDSYANIAFYAICTHLFPTTEHPQHTTQHKQSNWQRKIPQMTTLHTWHIYGWKKNVIIHDHIHIQWRQKTCKIYRINPIFTAGIK